MVELTKQQRKEAIGSVQQYFERNLPEPVGELAAGLLLDFFLQEIGPVVYNRAIADAQIRLQAKASELDGELYEAPFTYWLKSGKRAGR
jgi:uncharacterized protein (DUF2164 family)